MYTKKLKSYGLFLLPTLFALNANAMGQGARGPAYDADQAFAQEEYEDAQWQQAQQAAQQQAVKKPLRGPSRSVAQVTQTFRGGVASIRHEVRETTEDTVTIKKIVLLEVRDRHGREETNEFPIEKIPGYMPKECWQNIDEAYQKHTDQCQAGVVKKTTSAMQAVPENYKSINFVMERIVHNGVQYDQVTFETTATKEIVATWEEDEGERNISEDEFNAFLREVNGDVGRSADSAAACCAEELCHLNLSTPAVRLPGKRSQNL